MDADEVVGEVEECWWYKRGPDGPVFKGCGNVYPAGGPEFPKKGAGWAQCWYCVDATCEEVDENPFLVIEDKPQSTKVQGSACSTMDPAGAIASPMNPIVRASKKRKSFLDVSSPGSSSDQNSGAANQLFDPAPLFDRSLDKMCESSQQKFDDSRQRRTAKSTRVYRQDKPDEGDEFIRLFGDKQRWFRQQREPFKLPTWKNLAK